MLNQPMLTSTRRIICLSTGFMVFALAIDMGGEFRIRNIAVIFCAIILLLCFRLYLRRDWILIFFLLVCYPAAMLIKGIVSDADIRTAFSQFQSTVLAFFLLLVVYHVPYDVASRAFVYSLSVVALIAVILAAGLLMDITSVKHLLSLMAAQEGGYFGRRGIGPDVGVPNVYFKSTLFFVPALVFFFYMKKYFLAAICFVGLIVAVSKTGIAFSILASFIMLLRNSRMKGILVGCCFFIIFVVWLLQSPLYILFDEIADNRSGTVHVRMGHFVSLIKFWDENPFSFLFGAGLGSTYYSTGTGTYVSNIEIDHFNVIRKYGILWAMAFFLWVVSVVYSAVISALVEVRALGWALLSAFIVAGTNPVLISPLFFILVFFVMIGIKNGAEGCRYE